LNDYHFIEPNPIPQHDAVITSSSAEEMNPVPTTVPADTENNRQTQEYVEPAPVEAPMPAADYQQSAVVGAHDFVSEAARKSCQWCGAEATVGDRFCRVCGSVF
jgi:hypothetical protein